MLQKKQIHVHSRGTRVISKQVYPHYKPLWPGERGKDYLKYSCDEGDTVILIVPQSPTSVRAKELLQIHVISVRAGINDDIPLSTGVKAQDGQTFEHPNWESCP